MKRTMHYVLSILLIGLSFLCFALAIKSPEVFPERLKQEMQIRKSLEETIAHQEKTLQLRAEIQKTNEDTIAKYQQIAQLAEETYRKHEENEILNNRTRLSYVIIASEMFKRGVSNGRQVTIDQFQLRGADIPAQTIAPESIVFAESVARITPFLTGPQSTDISRAIIAELRK